MPANRGGGLQRSRVADDPQLGCGVVDIGVSGEGGGGISTATVVVLVTDVSRVVDRALLVSDVAHGGGWYRGQRKKATGREGEGLGRSVSNHPGFYSKYFEIFVSEFFVQFKYCACFLYVTASPKPRLPSQKVRRGRG